ncbi:MAG: aromatic amino acid lyase [Acidimicrobiales bacterium]
MSATADRSALLVRRASDLDRSALREVAEGRPLVLSDELLGNVADRRREVLAALAQQPAVYGVNTGMGALSDVRLDRAEAAAHQRSLLLARAVGGPPWLSPTEARAVMAVRLRTFLEGDAGVSAELCLALVALLAAEPVPAIPRGGSGSAGEIIPLAHGFGPLVGIGPMLVDGELVSSAACVELGPKEGVALLAGVPGTTALALLRADEADLLASQMLLVAAGAVAAVGGPADAYLPAVARGDSELIEINRQLAGALAGLGPPRMLQAPVSFRVVGPVLANLARAISRLEEAVDRALAGVNDSPAFLDGSFVGTPGFHGVDLAAHLDGLALALAHAAEVSSARIHRLLDPAVTGLNRQLAAGVPGPEAGLVAVHKRAVAASHASRRAAQPSILGPVETSGGQEDVQSFSWEAAEQLRVALNCAREVTACEALAVHQALRLRGGAFPAGVERLIDALAAVVPPITGDRPFGLDVEALMEALGEGRIAAAP